MIVFVHGVPETGAVWRKVQALVDDESVAPSLPGFGCPLPPGFEATKEGYVDWLVQLLRGVGGPIDLVGHDWGALLVYRIVTAGLHPVRSWVADVPNVMHPDYEWHPFAQLWQTPGEGEASIAAQEAMAPADLAAGFETLGIPPDDALEMAQAGDATMGASILALYRSATPNLHAHWGPLSPVSTPGVALLATHDPVGDEPMSREVAAALGARFETIDTNHFWPYEAPGVGAALLREFWASV